RTRALDPLAPEILRYFTAGKSTRSGVLNLDPGARDGRLWVEKCNPPPVPRPPSTPFNSGCHHRFSLSIESCQSFKCGHGFRREDIRVLILQVGSDFQLSRSHASPLL